MQVEFKPSKKQYEAWERLTDKTTRELGYGGGAGGGKSYLGCVWILSMCLAYPETTWLLGRKELVTLKRTTLLTMFKVFNEFGITESIYNYNQQNNTITFTNGSVIFLMDVGHKPSDPLYTRFGGLELTGYFIDESNECPEEAVNIIKTRTGRGKNKEYGLVPTGLETFNPDKGHVYRRFYKPYKEGKLPEHVHFIPALATDNDYIDEEYIEQLRNADKVTRERLLFGNFDYDDNPDLLINHDAIEDLWTNTVDGVGNFISADIARFGKDKTVIYRWRGLRLVEAKVIDRSSLEFVKETIREMASEHRVPYSQIIIDEDGVGGGVVDMLPGVKGFMGNRRPFDVRDMGKMTPANYSNLKTQCIFKLAELINQHKISVQVEDIRDKLAEELGVLQRVDVDKEGKVKVISKEAIKERIGRSPDFLDAMFMRVWFELAHITGTPRIPIRRPDPILNSAL